MRLALSPRPQGSPSAPTALTVLSPHLLSTGEISSRKKRRRPSYPVPTVSSASDSAHKCSIGVPKEINPLKKRKGLSYPVPHWILCIKLCPPHSKSSINVGYLNESNFYHFFIGLFSDFFCAFTLNPKYFTASPSFSSPFPPTYNPCDYITFHFQVKRSLTSPTRGWKLSHQFRPLKLGPPNRQGFPVRVERRFTVPTMLWILCFMDVLSLPMIEAFFISIIVGPKES